MGKYTLRVIAIILMAFFCSCEKSEPIGEMHDKSFRFFPEVAWCDNASYTKGASGGISGDILHPDFIVFGAMTGKESFNSSNHFNWMYRAKIVNNGFAWRYAETIGDYYFDIWKPDGLHSFFAFAPYDVINATGVSLTPSTIGANVKPTLSNFSVPTNSIKNGYDLMYATAMNIEGNKYPTGGIQGVPYPAGGEVVLKFDHALSQVSFDLKVHPKTHFEDATDYIQIKQVRFTNVKNRGTFTFYNSGNGFWKDVSGNTIISWGDNGEGVFTNARWDDSSKDNVVSAIPHIADGKTYIATMIPQEFADNAAVEVQFYRHSRRAEVNAGIFTQTFLIKDIAQIPENDSGKKIFERGKNYKFNVTIVNNEEVTFTVTLESWIIKNETLPIN